MALLIWICYLLEYSINNLGGQWWDLEYITIRQYLFYCVVSQKNYIFIFVTFDSVWSLNNINRKGY